ncbi:MAG: hypothetical protein FWC40_06405 [Proteobacteria bacterium]|nr:hypothetical protein [Pseudomonadota bacterium]
MLENAVSSSMPQVAARSDSNASLLAASTENLLTAGQVEAAKTYNRRTNQSIACEIQALVGVTVDGAIGPLTCQGIARWQRSKSGATPPAPLSATNPRRLRRHPL